MSIFLTVETTNINQPSCRIFDDRNAVCIPARSGKTLQLAHLSDCVWNGHPSLRTKHPLAIHSEYSNDPHVAYLFKDMLSVRDANVDTYLEELEWRKGNANGPLDDLNTLYDCISHNIQKPDDDAAVQ